MNEFIRIYEATTDAASIADGLSKTEQSILLKAAQRKSGSHAVEHASGQGSKGGKINWGKRDVDAAKSLVSKGLATINNESTGRNPKGGYTVDNYVVSFTINDLGREVAKVVEADKENQW